MTLLLVTASMYASPLHPDEQGHFGMPIMLTSPDRFLKAGEAYFDPSSKRVIFQAQKAARGPFVLLAPFVLHDGETHGEDAPDETPLARPILRDGTGLPL